MEISDNVYLVLNNVKLVSPKINATHVQILLKFFIRINALNNALKDTMKLISNAKYVDIPVLHVKIVHKIAFHVFLPISTIIINVFLNAC